jgi:hypothetical protein
MVDFGKAEVFKGKMAQPLDGIVRGNAAGADLFEQLADGIGVQEQCSPREAAPIDSAAQRNGSVYGVAPCFAGIQ